MDRYNDDNFQKRPNLYLWRWPNEWSRALFGSSHGIESTNDRSIRPNENPKETLENSLTVFEEPSVGSRQLHVS